VSLNAQEVDKRPSLSKELEMSMTKCRNHARKAAETKDIACKNEIKLQNQCQKNTGTKRPPQPQKQLILFLYLLFSAARHSLASEGITLSFQCILLQ